MNYQIFNDNLNVVELYDCEWDSFSIYVKSGVFSGRYNFYIELSCLRSNIIELEELSQKLSGEGILEDMDSDSHLKFVMQKYGKLSFSGKLGSSLNNNYVVFEFIADQTLLQNMIEALKKICG